MKRRHSVRDLLAFMQIGALAGASIGIIGFCLAILLCRQEYFRPAEHFLSVLALIGLLFAALGTAFGWFVGLSADNVSAALQAYEEEEAPAEKADAADRTES